MLGFKKSKKVSGDNPLDKAALKEKVIEGLRLIYDPEIPVNIYDLGLIYAVEIDDDAHVHIDMTLTAPGCPVAQTFPGMVETETKYVEGVKDATVQLVWDPPWTPECMDEATRLQLGWL